MNDDDHIDGQAVLEAFSALGAVEMCAMRVRLDNAQAERMVGVAPYGMKLLMQQEMTALRLVGDVDSWLRMRDISIRWTVTGSHGVMAGQEGASFEPAPPLHGLMLWPAAAD